MSAAEKDPQAPSGGSPEEQVRRTDSAAIAPENTAVASPRAPLVGDFGPKPPTKGLITRPAKPDPFHFLTEAELNALPPTTYLIEPVIPAGGTVIGFGRPGDGKSFVALDMGVAVSVGLPWQGHKTVQGPVAYVAAEGHSGISRRLKAWQLTHKVRQCPEIRFLPRPVQLHQSTEVDDLIDSLRAFPTMPVLVVIDTLARCFAGGDENSSAEVGLFIAGATRIQEETGAAVMIIHHTGRQGKNPRGSTALEGAADVTILIESLSRKSVSLTCKKQKDDAPFPKIWLELLTVDVGGGRTSCALVSSTEVARPSSQSLYEVLLSLGGSATSAAFKTASGLGDSTFYKKVKDLDPALVGKTGEGKATRYTVLVTPPSSTAGFGSTSHSITTTPPPPLGGESGVRVAPEPDLEDQQ